MLDGYIDLLTTGLRDLWPVSSLVAEGIEGRLMGGTALALHLRHRASEDIDIMTLKPFDGRHVRGMVDSHLRSVRPDDYWRTHDVVEARNNGYCAIINDVRFDVFLALGSGDAQASDMRWLQEPNYIDGMAVGSVPDIFAAKLAAAADRKKLRDFIDLAAIDRHSGYTLEDGLEFYRRAFGLDTAPNPGAMRRVLRAMADPGYVEPDRAFEALREDTLTHLRHRAEDLQHYMAEIVDQDVQAVAAAHAANLGAARPSATPGRCGQWMPRARTQCALPPRHKGPHRRSR